MQPISFFAELPESVYNALQQWLNNHPNDSLDTAIAAAINQFLTREESQCK